MKLTHVWERWNTGVKEKYFLFLCVCMCMLKSIIQNIEKTNFQVKQVCLEYNCLSAKIGLDWWKVYLLHACKVLWISVLYR